MNTSFFIACMMIQFQGKMVAKIRNSAIIDSNIPYSLFKWNGRMQFYCSCKIYFILYK